ncbi:MAG: hypothetical protein ABI562_04315 [Chloroflexota bacterium]
MYELSLAHLNAADRDREIDADLRTRQILKAPVKPTVPAETRATAMPAARRQSTPVRSTQR